MKKWIVSVGVVVIACLAILALNTDLLQAGTHTRGALVCSACHTMHHSRQDPDTTYNGAAIGNPSLLIDVKADNAICLACHDDRVADTSLAPTVFSLVGADPLYPGGDFDNVSAGGEFGHFQTDGSAIQVDTDPATAPGSDGNATPFPSSQLACWSCHDPHAAQSVSNRFRLLRKQPIYLDGTVYSEVSTNYLVDASGANLGTSAAPVAEANNNHTQIRSGISAWCGTCHSEPSTPADQTGFHGSSVAVGPTGDGTNFIKHPTDNVLNATYGARYTASTQDDYLVPLEDTTDDWTIAVVANPTPTGDKVMCLSCHRAHVGRDSGGTVQYDALRWDPTGGLDTNSGCNHCHRK